MSQTGQLSWMIAVKFFIALVAMVFLFPLLGLIAYRPLTVLAEVLRGGDLLRIGLTRALLVVSIIFVSLVTGVLFPRDRRVVQLAAMASIVLFFVDSVGTEVYFAVCIAGSPLPYSHIGWLGLQFILIFVLGWWFSSVAHRLTADTILSGKRRARKVK